MIKMPAHLTEIIHRNAGYICAAPGGNFAVSVFPDNKSVNAPAVHPQMFAEGIFQPRRIKDCAGTQHPLFLKSADFYRCIGQDIHRIGHHQKKWQ